MPQWTLTTEEILALLNHEQIKPRPGSPWFDIQPEPSIKTSPANTGDKRELREALLRIACPEIIQGILHCPPDPPVVRWFYGAYGNELMAGHYSNEQDQHTILWPLSAQDLTSLLELPLSIHQPEVVEGFALTLSREGFAAFTAIVDLQQEEALIAALKREYPGNLKFHPDDLIKVAKRHRQGLDLRWLGQLAKFISPAPFHINTDSLDIGIQELLAQQMLTLKDHHYQPAPRFYEACTLLNACTGFSALTTRLRNGASDADTATWEHQHVAALRGLGSFWLLDFSEITPDNFHVDLGDVSADLLHKRLQAGMSVNMTKPPSQCTAPASAPTPLLSCPECGRPLAPDTALCSVCSKHKKTVTPSPVKPEPVLSSDHAPAEKITCPTCGTLLLRGIKFCNQCGAPVSISESAVETPVPPATPVCGNCKAPVTPDMKFCTQCGKPLTNSPA